MKRNFNHTKITHPLHGSNSLLVSVGLKFWKAPRRKIFDVSKNVRSKGKKRSGEDFFSDSDDDVTPKRKKCGLPLTCGDVQDNILCTGIKVDQLKEDLLTLKVEVEDLSASSNVPLGLKRVIKDTFQSKICLMVPINPPVVMSKCCRCIIGCEKCVNNWFSGEDALTKACPNCRAKRGYSETMLLRGLDVFLTDVKNVFQLRPDSPDVE